MGFFQLVREKLLGVSPRAPDTNPQDRDPQSSDSAQQSLSGRLLVREPTLAEWVQNDRAGPSSSPAVGNGKQTVGFHANGLIEERSGAKRRTEGTLADLVPPAQRRRQQSALQPNIFQDASEPDSSRARASGGEALKDPQLAEAHWVKLQALSEAGDEREPGCAPGSPASRAVAGKPGMGVVRSPEQLFPDATRRGGAGVSPADNTPTHAPSPATLRAEEAWGALPYLVNDDGQRWSKHSTLPARTS